MRGTAESRFLPETFACLSRSASNLSRSASCLSRSTSCLCRVASSEHTLHRGSAHPSYKDCRSTSSPCTNNSTVSVLAFHQLLLLFLLCIYHPLVPHNTRFASSQDSFFPLAVGEFVLSFGLLTAGAKPFWRCLVLFACGALCSWAFLLQLVFSMVDKQSPRARARCRRTGYRSKRERQQCPAPHLMTN
jgi:hypothetical protein